MPTGGNVLADSGNTAGAHVYVEGTFAPTVTGPATVPVYATNNGRHTRKGRAVDVDVYLTGDGGNEGAGTQISIALPITASASHDTAAFPCGYAINGTTPYLLLGIIVGGGTTIALYRWNAATVNQTFDGDQQNTATRTIRLKFSYEV